MNASTAHRPVNPLELFLAGLQAGMIGICWMLAWLGLSAMQQRRSFWTAENLMATLFHGGAAIRRGFGTSTLSGIALYLLIYSLLGAGFALAARSRFTGLGTVLLGVLFSMGWYWLWFRALGQTEKHGFRTCDLRSLDGPLPGLSAQGATDLVRNARGRTGRRDDRARSRLELSGAGL
jgi:hypothetical protein